MSSLKDKIREVEDQHADETVEQHLAVHDKRSQDQALLLLGGIRAVNRITENLSSQVMEALIAFQKEGMSVHFGFERFADFLDQSEYSPMKKSEFYRRKELYEAEGGLLYDAFNSARIPLSTRKLLASHNGSEIAIDGDELVVGAERIPIGNVGLVKEVVQSFADEISTLLKEQAKAKSKIDSQDEQIKKGTDEYNELQRAMDAVNEQTPFERALMGVVNANLKFISEIKALPESERTARAESDLKTLAEQYFQARDAYGVRTALAERSGQPATDNGQPATDADFDAKLAAAIAEDDDLDAEEDVD